MVLSEELGIPASTIRNFRNNNGIKTQYKLAYLSKEEFISKYHELKSQEKMAQYYNVDHHTINDFSKSIGFDDSIYKRQQLNKNQINYIIENYDKKSSIQIAKEINVKPSAVSGVWHRNQLVGKSSRIYKLINENYFEHINSQDKAYFLIFSPAALIFVYTPNCFLFSTLSVRLIYTLSACEIILSIILNC